MPLKDRSVAFVLTSCKRWDLLQVTLESFLTQNTHPIDKYILVEDSPGQGLADLLKPIEEKYGIAIELICNDPGLGQRPSIEKAYAAVGNESYIFHCEDDWLFYRSGFIEDSIHVLEQLESVVVVWMRDRFHYIAENYSTNRKVVGQKISGLTNTEAYRINYNCGSEEATGGFTFNPGLRRSEDCKDLRYQDFKNELELSIYFGKRGRNAVILANGAVVHIGDGHHVTEPAPKLLKRIANKLDSYSSRFRR